MSKTVKNILVGIGAVVTIALMILVYDCGHQRGEFGMEKVVAEFDAYRAEADSIAAIPPDTIRDTLIIRPDPEIKWFERLVHEPATVDSTGTTLIQDSLVNDELAFYLLDSINGKLLWRKMGYRLFVPKEVTITETVTESVPVFVDKPVPTYYDGLWLSGHAGGGAEFAYSLGLDYSKGRNKFGVSYMRFGETNNWLVGYSRLIYKLK